MKTSLEHRFRSVRQRISEACLRSGRVPEDVRMVAVSKMIAPEKINEAAAFGQMIFGESRVQEAREKVSLCPSRLVWHMVGHLQSNKARPAVQLFQMIHSIDSEKLLRAVDRASCASGLVMPVCLEVNVSGEGSKFGLAPDMCASVLKAAESLMHVDLAGLMTIPPACRDPERARPYFRMLRELRDRLRNETGFSLPELSMGMTNDFEIAIEEGATLVRVGTALFGARMD